MALTDRSDVAARASTRVFVGLALVGLLVGIAGIVQDSELMVLGAQLIAVALTLVLVAPAGFALGIGLVRPAALADGTRVGALLAGLAGALLGWLVLHAHSGPSVPVGVALMVSGVLAASVVVRAPRPARWRPAAGQLLAGLLLVVVLGIVPKFEGPKPHAYYLGMQRAMREVARWQEAVRADSGHYARQLGTAELWEVASFLRAEGSLHIAVEGDGYRAWATTRLAPGRCAVYVGGRPEPPATAPGVAACTPYPETGTASFGMAWLLAVLITGVVGWLGGRPADS